MAIRITFEAEDTLLNAELRPVVVGKHDDGSDKVEQRWCGTAVDLFAAKRQEFQLTDAQMAALTNLGLFSVGEESLPGYDVPTLYADAPDKDWDVKVCP